MDCSPPGSCPWDSLGKNTAVDCHALLQGIFLTQGSNLNLLHCRQILYSWATGDARYISLKNKSESENESRSVMSEPLQPHGLYSPRNSPGQNTGVGSLSLLQGSFPTQGLNPGLPHCRQILYQLSHQGSPYKCLVQLSSVGQSCPTLCNPMNRSTSGLPVHHKPPDSTQTHVHWVSDAMQPSHPLSSPSPPALNLSQHQGLFEWVSSSHQVARVLVYQPQHQSFQWTPRTDFL